MITSMHNPRVKEAARLRDRRGRDKQGRIIIDGAREIARAVQADCRIVELFLAGEVKLSPLAAQTRDLCRSKGIETVEVASPVFAKLAYGDRTDGLVAVADPPHRTLETLQVPEEPLIAVMEGVEKPGNLGAICRSADGAGLDALIAASPGTDLFNPNVIRASLGTIFSMPSCAATSAETLAWLRQRQAKICVARLATGNPYTAFDFTGPVAIVLGSEAGGLTETWCGPEVIPVSIPMRGRADSLNVSAAAAILFYEALRQRSAAGPGLPRNGDGGC